MLRLILCLLVPLLFSCDYYIVQEYDEHVGLIKTPIDDQDALFKPCFGEKIFPYYYGRQIAEHTRGKDYLRKYFTENFQNFGNTIDSGFITFRFLINCKGEAGYYEIRQVGLDFKAKEFKKNMIDHMLGLVRNLQDWKPIEFFGDRYDCFYHLTFKIQHGELVEILP